MNNLNYKFRNPKLLNAILVCVFSIFFTLNVSAQRDGDGGGLDCPPPSAPTSIECAGDNCPQTCACDIQGPTGSIASGMPVDFAMLGGIPNDYVAWEIRLTTNNLVIASGSGSLIDDFAFPSDPRGESFNYSVCFTTGYYPQSCGGANSVNFML